MAERIAEHEERPNRRAHPKNTKRWCRGAIGREHVTRLLVPSNAISRECDTRESAFSQSYDWEIGCHHVEQCINCGKHVRPFLNNGECPDRTSPHQTSPGQPVGAPRADESRRTAVVAPCPGEPHTDV